MISIKDYAEKCGVSYEAIRQQIDRYAEELGEHVVKDGRTRYLDDDAVRILDEHRIGNPVIIQVTERDAEIESLRQENTALRERIIEMQERYNQQITAQNAQIANLSERVLAITDQQIQEQSQTKKHHWWEFWK